MDKNILRHNFVEPKKIDALISSRGGDFSNEPGTYGTNNLGTINQYNNTIGTPYNGLIGHESYIGNSMTVGGRYNAIGTEEFRASATFTHDMAHTMSREEVTVHLKRQIMAEVFENMVRGDMFEFWSTYDPSTMGERINCRLKVVRPQN
jgi:hypothetical protein